MNIRICAAMVAAGATVMAFDARAFESGSLWEVEVETSLNDGASETSTSYLCQPNGTWDNPPEELAGRVCPDPKFAQEGDTLSWEASCDAGQGQGQINLKNDGRRLEGDGRMVTPKGELTFSVSAKVVDKCTL